MSTAHAHTNFDAIPPEEPANNGRADESMFEEFTPLARVQPPESYPVQFFPPRVAEAIRAQQAYGQQPVAMVGSSALASLSLAGQGLVNVARDSELVSPVSLNIAVIANSGERKSACDSALTAGARRWERDKHEELGEVEACSAMEALSYEAERDGLLAKLKKAADDDVKATEIREKLRELAGRKPPAFFMPRLFFEDMNAPSVAVKLGQGWPSASIWSAEGGAVIGSDATRNENLLAFLALCNKLWDGAEYIRDRITTPSVRVKGRRLTVCIMIQPSVFDMMMASEQMRGTGYLARTLMCDPESTMGTRLYRPPHGGLDAVGRFNCRIYDLLGMKMATAGDNMELCPSVLQLADDSKALWVEFHDSVETQLGSAGDLADVADFAAKAADNAARIAALFHVFEAGPEAQISIENMQRGAALAGWYLNETLRLINCRTIKPEMRNAARMWDWMCRVHEATGRLEISTTYLGQRCPGPFRPKAIWEPVISTLAEHGYVVREKSTIHMNPEALRHV